MVIVAKEHIMGTVEMREAYCNALIDAANSNPNIVSLNCDMSSSCGTVRFAEAFPDRSFNFGIQEACACSAAAGMSAAGLIPFFHSFAVFASRRIYDQIFISCAYAGMNVKIMGFDAGVSATYNGGTHMAFDDVGILRGIPGITIVEPSDVVMMKSLVKLIAETYGLFYMRTARKPVECIYQNGSNFEIGKAAMLRDGKDVSIIASGMAVIEALRAADMLKQQGINARVIDMFTIKPIDAQCIIDCASNTGAIVTVENHNIIGGLGSAVSEVLTDNISVPLGRVGVNEEFGEVGTQDYLKKRYGIVSHSICEKVNQVFSRKS